MTQRTALILSALMTTVIMSGIALLGNLAQAATLTSTPPGPAPMAQAVATIRVEPTDEPTAEPTEPDSTATPEYQVSSDQASDVALKAAPGTALTGTPELVDFQGAVAYEVILTAGKVYIDANSGKILFNGTLAAATTGPVDQEQAAQIAVMYMQNNNDSTEVTGIRFGRLRKLQGLRVFEVTFIGGVRVYVNAQTGEIALVSKPQGDN